MRRALAVALALAVLAPVGGARAGHGGGGCGYTGLTWSSATSARCSFVFRGLPITVFGHVRDPAGDRTVGIHVWVTQADQETVADAAGVDPAVITECAAGGAGERTCDGELSIGEPVDTLIPTGASLFCHVTTTPANTSWKPQMHYYCASGRGF